MANWTRDLPDVLGLLGLRGFDQGRLLGYRNDLLLCLEAHLKIDRECLPNQEHHTHAFHFGETFFGGGERIISRLQQRCYVNARLV